MIKQKQDKNAPHFSKQRIDLWALKKQVEALSINDGRLLRYVQNLQNLVSVLDEEVIELREQVLALRAKKTSFWQKLKACFVAKKAKNAVTPEC